MKICLNKTKNPLIVILILSCLLYTHVDGQDKRPEKFDSLLSSLHSKDLFNGNVLIAEKGKVIFQKSYGYANLQTRVKLDKNSMFELASVTKQFTSMAILILVQERKLSLNDSLRKFFPELPYKNITVKNLLNHTGGEPDYSGLIEKYWNKSEIISNNQAIALLAKYAPPGGYAPGDKWEYSNTGYMLLASIIEKVSGITYRDFLVKKIFKPLRMKRTTVYNRRYRPQTIDNYAFGYVFNDSLKKWILPDSMPEYRVVIYTDGIVGDGCVNSTTADLLKWDRALYTEKLVSKELLNLAFEQTKLNDGSRQDYGFGWGMYSKPLYGKVVFHSGGWPGYLTWISRYIDTDKTIIILMNHFIPSQQRLPKSIEKILHFEGLPSDKKLR